MTSEVETLLLDDRLASLVNPESNVLNPSLASSSSNNISSTTGSTRQRQGNQPNELPIVLAHQPQLQSSSLSSSTSSTSSTTSSTSLSPSSSTSSSYSLQQDIEQVVSCSSEKETERVEPQSSSTRQTPVSSNCAPESSSSVSENNLVACSSSESLTSSSSGSLQPSNSKKFKKMANEIDIISDSNLNDSGIPMDGVELDSSTNNVHNANSNPTHNNQQQSAASTITTTTTSSSTVSSGRATDLQQLARARLLSKNNIGLNNNNEALASDSPVVSWFEESTHNKPVSGANSPDDNSNNLTQTMATGQGNGLPTINNSSAFSLLSNENNDDEARQTQQQQPQQQQQESGQKSSSSSSPLNSYIRNFGHLFDDDDLD